MKKLMTIVLALMLILGMNVSVFAADATLVPTETGAPVVSNVQVASVDPAEVLPPATEGNFYTDTKVNVSGTVTVANDKWTVNQVTVEGTTATTIKTTGTTYNFSQDLDTPSTEGIWNVDIAANVTNPGGQIKTYTYQPVQVEVVARPVVEEGVVISALSIKQDNRNNTVLWGTVTETYIGQDGKAVVISYDRAFPLQKADEKAFVFEVNGAIYTQTVSKVNLAN